jgi:hypothetical protein
MFLNFLFLKKKKNNLVSYSKNFEIEKQNGLLKEKKKSVLLPW